MAWRIENAKNPQGWIISELWYLVIDDVRVCRLFIVGRRLFAAHIEPRDRGQSGLFDLDDLEQDIKATAILREIKHVELSRQFSRDERRENQRVEGSIPCTACRDLSHGRTSTRKVRGARNQPGVRDCSCPGSNHGNGNGSGVSVTINNQEVIND